MITIHKGQYLSDVMNEIPSDCILSKRYPAVELLLWNLILKEVPLSLFPMFLLSEANVANMITCWVSMKM